ncbi:helix-turn-helix domain-containing protein [Streptomyces sp. H10-C2]|uniref:TetR/AcrR family transcriptional regulator n=1 Tax=unclassified Streptomyces TaxID=2593676 RepID=UPI0024B98656|nr:MULTISPECIES: TetR/AcrR family transcriptional regulator [unclassified Streptomyces]MDJ0342341.1 helix-turn-helix domain-containing protein [Streptomyces sp. PH10-H1]MDJ0372196.1 helix-turn-helix domain-containing protein [Streptomyces sp. H10-C2]
MVGSAVKTRSPRLRADASRNRERIVAAAREAFVEHGAEVPLDEVARRAGVGNATLYRNFADRAELVREVVLSVMARIAERTEALVAEEPDAFEALRRFVFESAEDRVGALCPMLSEAFDGNDPAIFAARDRLDRAIEDIMDRARSSGQLRTDIAVGDLMVAITQLTRPLPGTACMDMDRFVHRHLQIFLDGLRAPARSVLPGAAVTLEDLQRQR